MSEDLTRGKGRPRAFNSAEELRGKCMEYFAAWELSQRPLTVVGLAVYLDVCKETLREYESKVYDTEDEDYSGTIKKAKDYIENQKWERALMGNYNPAVAIFDLKNNHGATDRMEHLGKNGESLYKTNLLVIDSVNAEEAASLYNDLLRNSE